MKQAKIYKKAGRWVVDIKVSNSGLRSMFDSYLLADGTPVIRFTYDSWQEARSFLFD